MVSLRSTLVPGLSVICTIRGDFRKFPPSTKFLENLQPQQDLCMCYVELVCRNVFSVPTIAWHISDITLHYITSGPSRATAGPGKTLSRGPIISPPILYGLRSRCRRRREGGNVGEVSPHHPTRGLNRGNVVSSPSGALAKNGFYAYFRSERSNLTPFQYF